MTDTTQNQVQPAWCSQSGHRRRKQYKIKPTPRQAFPENHVRTNTSMAATALQIYGRAPSEEKYLIFGYRWLDEGAC